MTNLHRVTNPWLSEIGTDDIIALRDYLDWIQTRLFNQYEPDWYETFDDKIANWLDNVASQEDKMSLFRLLEHLFFVGKAQFDALSRAAFDDHIVRWIIDRGNFQFEAPSLIDSINNSVSNTWFCPITDSMRINSFLKLNRLNGHDFRPDWRSLAEFGDVSLIEKFIKQNSITGIVLLEDFVGGGKQMSSVIKFIAQNFPGTPTLVVPLICCPGGLKKGIALQTKYSSVTFEPVLRLRDSLFLKSAASPHEPEIYEKIRGIIQACKGRFDEWESDPFGWDDTGALVALFTNCPDNSLPALFHAGDNWNALFTRMRRG